MANDELWFGLENTKFDPGEEAKIQGKAFSAARHEVHRRLGDFLNNAANEQELVQRMAMSDEAIESASTQHLAGVITDPKDKLATSLLREWQSKHAAFEKRGNCDCGHSYGAHFQNSKGCENCPDQYCGANGKWAKCSDCGGSGRLNSAYCSRCGGSGKVPPSSFDPTDRSGSKHAAECPDCAKCHAGEKCICSSGCNCHCAKTSSKEAAEETVGSGSRLDFSDAPSGAKASKTASTTFQSIEEGLDHLHRDHGDTDDLGQLGLMNLQQLNDTHADWHRDALESDDDPVHEHHFTSTASEDQQQFRVHVEFHGKPQFHDVTATDKDDAKAQVQDKLGGGGDWVFTRVVPKKASGPSNVYRKPRTEMEAKDHYIQQHSAAADERGMGPRPSGYSSWQSMHNADHRDRPNDLDHDHSGTLFLEHADPKTAAEPFDPAGAQSQDAYAALDEPDEGDVCTVHGGKWEGAYDDKVGANGAHAICSEVDGGFQSPLNLCEWKSTKHGSKTAGGQITCPNCKTPMHYDEEYADQAYDRDCPACGQPMNPLMPKKSSKTAGYRAEVAGVGENQWSNNDQTFETQEEAERAGHDLMSRWMGADMARVVPHDHPFHEPIDPADDKIIANWRTSSKTAAEDMQCANCGAPFQFGMQKCPQCGNDSWKPTEPSAVSEAAAVKGYGVDERGRGFTPIGKTADLATTYCWNCRTPIQWGKERPETCPNCGKPLDPTKDHDPQEHAPGGKYVESSKTATDNFSLAGDIANMEHGDRREYESEGAKFGVSYYERQSHGDDGQPVPGQTVGEFTITHPNGHMEDVHKSPETGGGSKYWAAEQVAKKMHAHWSDLKIKRMTQGSKTATWPLHGECSECGEPLIADESPGVWHHADESSPTGIDHDADADHAPYPIAPEGSLPGHRQAADDSREEGHNKFRVDKGDYHGKYTDQKMEDCVQDLKKKGHTEESAIKICKAGGAGQKNPKTHPVGKDSAKQFEDPYGIGEPNSPSALYMHLMTTEDDNGETALQKVTDKYGPKSLHNTGVSSLAMAQWDDPRFDAPALAAHLHGMLLGAGADEHPAHKELVDALGEGVRKHGKIGKDSAKPWMSGSCASGNCDNCTMKHGDRFNACQCRNSKHAAEWETNGKPTGGSDEKSAGSDPMMLGDAPRHMHTPNVLEDPRLNALEDLEDHLAQGHDYSPGEDDDTRDLVDNHLWNHCEVCGRSLTPFEAGGGHQRCPLHIGTTSKTADAEGRYEVRGIKGEMGTHHSFHDDLDEAIEAAKGCDYGNVFVAGTDNKVWSTDQKQSAEEQYPSDSSLYQHLHYNHYPPVHEAFIPAAREAIHHAQDALDTEDDEPWDRDVDTPNGPMKVHHIIEGLHLDGYLESPEERYREDDEDEGPDEGHRQIPGQEHMFSSTDPKTEPWKSPGWVPDNEDEKADEANDDGTKTADLDTPAYLRPCEWCGKPPTEGDHVADHWFHEDQGDLGKGVEPPDPPHFGDGIIGGYEVHDSCAKKMHDEIMKNGELPLVPFSSEGED